MPLLTISTSFLTYFSVQNLGRTRYEDGRYYAGRQLAGQRVVLTVFPDCLLVDHISGFHKELKRFENGAQR